MVKTKSELQRYRLIIIFLSVTITIMLASILAITIALDNKNRKINRLNVLLETCNESVEKVSINKYEGVNKKQLRENICSYIKIRYTRIPKEVAASIADNVIIFSDKHEMLPQLLVGMIEIESQFNPMAISKKDARGLMQVMPEWVPKLKINNVNDLHDVDIGIEAGIKVFKIHLNEAKGNISKGLYLYVGKNLEYVDNVYSAVGRFVTYQSK